MPCIGNVPSIVASGSIVQASGGNFSAVTLYTPAAAGLFRVSFYVDGDNIGGGHSAGGEGPLSNASILLSWTDASNPQENEISSQTLAPASYTELIHSVADAIQLSISGNGQTIPYTVFYVVEQLA
jgi:hypothetical protein